MCQSSQRLPRIVSESLRFMDSIPAGVQQSMSQVFTVYEPFGYQIGVKCVRPR